MGDINIKRTGKPSLEDAGDRDADRDRDSVDRLGGLPEEGKELVYYLVGAVVLLFLLKYYTQFRLRKKTVRL